MKNTCNTIVSVCLMMLLTPKTNAQTETLPTPSSRVKYFCEVNGGYLAGAELRAMFHVKNGLSFGNHFDASLGLGLEKYVPGRFIPVFLEGRYNILNRKTTPFVSISAGYLQGVNQLQVYYEPESRIKGFGISTGAKIGMQHAFTSNLSIVTSVGYRHTYAERVGVEGGIYYLQYQPVEMSYNMNRFELNIGLIFK